MASSHVARITAGGVSDRRIAHSLYGVCTTAATTVTKEVNLYTGNSTVADGTWSSSDLFHGLTIKVRFQYHNAATAPKLNVNGTGAKIIYCYNTVTPTKNNATESWGSGQIVTFTYDTLLNSSGCWVINYGYRYDNNTYDRMLIDATTIKAASTAIATSNIIVANSNGLYKQLNHGTTFDITYPILYTGSGISANSVPTGGIYTDIPFDIATTQNLPLTPHKAIYIKGTLDGVNFTPVSTAPLTQTVPSSADNYQYILLGYARYVTPNTNAYLLRDHPIFEYTGGKFHQLGTTAGTSAYHTSVTKTAGSTASYSIAHYLGTKDIIVQARVNNGTNEFIASKGTFSTSNDISYGIKIVDQNSIQIAFNPNSVWSSLAGTVSFSILATSAFSVESDQSLLRIG